MLCSDAADATRDTVAGMIEDSTGSELLSKLYTGGMNAADFAAQTLATGGASTFKNFANGLVAVTKALGDDFVRTFIKSYGDDAVKAIAAHGDDMGKLALHSTDDAAKLLLSSSDDVGKAALSYTDDAGKTLLSSGDNMIDDWYGIIDDTVDGAAKSWDDVANSIDDVADDALAAKPNTGYNGSTGAGNSGILNPPKPLSLSDIETRRWYLNAEAQIPDLIDITKPLEQQAMQASALRNQVRTQAREAMTNRDLANSLFGSRPNMTWDEVVQKYTDKGYGGDELYQEIIKAALRSNPSVNQYLGVFPK